MASSQESELVNRVEVTVAGNFALIYSQLCL